MTIDTKPLDLQAALLVKFDTLQTGVAQLLAESSNTAKVLTRMENAIERLEARDNTQQQNIDGLRIDFHRLEAGLATLSNAIVELHTQGELLRVLQERLDRVARRVEALETCDQTTAQKLEACSEIYHKWRPWWEGFKWLVLGIGAVALGALAVWLLRDLAQSIVAVGL